MRYRIYYANGFTTVDTIQEAWAVVQSHLSSIVFYGSHEIVFHADGTYYLK